MNVKNKKTKIGDERYLVIRKDEWRYYVLTEPKTYDQIMLDIAEQRKFYPEFEFTVVEMLNV